MIINALESLSIVTTGLFCGLMMTLVFILQKQWILLDDENYKNYFRLFLKVAKGHWLITFLTIYSFIGPILLGINKIQMREGKLLVLAGFIFFMGCFVVTLKFNFPIYNMVMKLSNNEIHNTNKIKKRFYHLNMIRFLSSLAALLILLIYH